MQKAEVSLTAIELANSLCLKIIAYYSEREILSAMSCHAALSELSVSMNILLIW